MTHAVQYIFKSRDTCGRVNSSTGYAVTSAPGPQGDNGNITLSVGDPIVLEYVLTSQSISELIFVVKYGM